MKTSELTGAALDWAVAKCEGKIETGVYGTPWLNEGKLHLHYCDKSLLSAYDPSTDWAQGGPIIEREAITVSEGSPVIGLEWMACDRSSGFIQHGSTYLVSAMRCYVASKLGDVVDVPEELV